MSFELDFKTRDPLSRVLTALLTALPLPSSQRRDLRGAEPISPCSKLAPLFRLYAAAASRPQRNVVPFTQMRCKMTASFRANATFARFMPRRCATSSAQRLKGREAHRPRQQDVRPLIEGRAHHRVTDPADCARDVRLTRLVFAGGQAEVCAHALWSG